MKEIFNKVTINEIPERGPHAGDLFSDGADGYYILCQLSLSPQKSPVDVLYIACSLTTGNYYRHPEKTPEEAVEHLEPLEGDFTLTIRPDKR